MKEKLKDFLINFTNVSVMIFCLLAYLSIAWGFVVYRFWYWFILPVFNILPNINFKQAVGISIVLNLFKNYNTLTIKNKDKDYDTYIALLLIIPIIIITFGWIVFNFINWL